MDLRNVLAGGGILLTLGGAALRVNDRVTTLQADRQHDKEERERLETEIRRLQDKIERLQADQVYYHGKRTE